jgi:hypothetical protein
MQEKNTNSQHSNKDARRDSIVPFTERPSEGRAGKPIPPKAEDKLNGTELFSLFTADIIREDVPFTR